VRRSLSLRNWVIVGILCSAPALAQAQQQFGDPVNFPGQYLTRRSSTPNGTSIDVQYVSAGAFTPGMSAAITQAAAVWNAAGANVQLVTGPAPSTAFVLGLPFGPNPGITLNNTTPGTGTFPGGISWQQITGSLTLVNLAAPNWFVGPGSPAPGQLDFLSYMIQQFGFALGLGNTGLDPGSVMANLAPGTTQRVLSPGDIAALQILYGAPEPETWALFGVGLVALGALKRSRRPVRAAL
jgi:hypothetical protein